MNKEALEDPEELARENLRLRSALKQVATSLSHAAAVRIARRALDEPSELIDQSRQDAIENEQYVP